MTELLKNSFTGLLGNAVLSLMTGADIRDEVSAWVTLVGSVAITLTTIGIQIYHLIRDRNEDKKENQPADAENEEKENDKRNG